MSYNMIDFTLFEQVDALVESHYHRTFASRAKYVVRNIRLNELKFSFDIELQHTLNEAADPKYAEVVVSKLCRVSYNNLYETTPYEKLVQGLDIALGGYYVVESIDDEIVITSKEKGKTPSIITPRIHIKNKVGIEFDLNVKSYGTDTSIFVPNEKQNVIHLPKTTFGDSYTPPSVGDRLIIIDSVEDDRDRTFTREVTRVYEHAKCTCDVIELDLPIDRLQSNHNRINGIGLTIPTQNSNNYTARFTKTKLFKRKSNYKEILENRAKSTGECTIPIGNYANMKEIAPIIVQDFIKKSENPHLNAKMNYFGATIHWKEYEEYLKPIYEEYGEYLTDHLFLLTSNRNRPEYLVHIDYDHYDTSVPVIASFTWPVLNCTSDTTTVWYKCFENGKEIYQYGKQDVVITDQNLKLIEIDRYSFSTEEFNAVILKHDDWHTLYNNSNSESNRMLLQWRFKPDIPWERVKQIVNMISQS